MSALGGGPIPHAMFEVVIEKRGQFRWACRVGDRMGKIVVHGSEETRNARYRGERALFQLLLLRVPRLPQLPD
jgi:hypothetical protein